MMKRAFRHIAISLGALLLLPSCGNRMDDDQQIDHIYEVTRGNFNIVISATGTLDAIKRYDIKAPRISKKGLKIIEAIEDQTPLKKGDLIIACSDEDYLDVGMLVPGWKFSFIYFHDMLCIELLF